MTVTFSGIEIGVRQERFQEGALGGLWPKIGMSDPLWKKLQSWVPGKKSVDLGKYDGFHFSGWIHAGVVVVKVVFPQAFSAEELKRYCSDSYLFDDSYIKPVGASNRTVQEQIEKNFKDGVRWDQKVKF